MTMSDKEFREQKRRIMPFIDLAKRVLWVNSWEKTFYWVRGFKDGGRNVIAECATQWEYLQFTVTFYLGKVAEISDDDLKDTVLHEFIHAMVAEMREWRRAPIDCSDELEEAAVQHEERVVTLLTRSILAAIALGESKTRRKAPRLPPAEDPGD